MKLQYKFLFLMLCMDIFAIDFSFYCDKYGSANFCNAMFHFFGHKQKEHLQTSPINIKNTNFDWQYYIKENNLHNLSTEEAAYEHYVNIGKSNNLPYCKSFKIVILLHLYNLELMDEFIEKINYFMNNNPQNIFFIKINIPVDERIYQFKSDFSSSTKLSNLTKKEIYSEIKLHTPYHPNIIDEYNSDILYDILICLKQRLLAPSNNIQIIFSENRGLDIGGFFLLLDQLINENLEFDYLIKLHTKTCNHNKYFGYRWRQFLISFLNVKINRILNEYECIYSCKLKSVDDGTQKIEKFQCLKKRLHERLNIPELQNFDFCAGTMFIAPFKFFKFLRQWNMLEFFNMLNCGYHGIGFEHVFERVFGEIFCLLELKTLCLGYYPQNYPCYYEI